MEDMTYCNRLFPSVCVRIFSNTTNPKSKADLMDVMSFYVDRDYQLLQENI